MSDIRSLAADKLLSDLISRAARADAAEAELAAFRKCMEVFGFELAYPRGVEQAEAVRVIEDKAAWASVPSSIASLLPPARTYCRQAEKPGNELGGNVG